MKKALYSILLYILVFSFSMSFFNGITLPMQATYWILLSVLFAVAVMMHKPLLRFLTVKVNFVTFWLSAALLSLGMFYLTELLIPGFLVEMSTFEGSTYGTITIGAFEMSKVVTMIAASVLFSGVCALMDVLGGSSE